MRKWFVSKTRLFYSSFYQIPHVWQYDPQKPLRYLAIYYLQLERGEGGRKRATVAAERTVEILKCEVPMKRARNILSQRMPLNEVNLFWTRPIFSFGTLFSSSPLNAKVSQLSFQYPASPTTINNSTIQISRIYYPFVNYTKGGGIEKPESIRSIQCSANIESKTRKNRNRVLTR